MSTVENMEELETTSEVENTEASTESNSVASESALNGGDIKPTDQEPLVRPSRKDFDTDDAYEDAKEAYLEKKILTPVQKAHEEERERMMRTIKATRLEKRELKAQIEDLKDEFGRSKIPDPTKMVEPRIEWFPNNPQAYAEELANFRLAKMLAENAQQQQPIKVVPPDAVQEWSQQLGDAMQQDPELAEGYRRMNEANAGAHLAPDALMTLFKSPINVRIYKYFSENIERVEDIEDLPASQQAKAIKRIESRLLNGLVRSDNATQTAPKRDVEKQTGSKPRVSSPPAVVPSSGGRQSTAARHPSEYKTTEEFMAARKQRVANGNW